MKQAMAFVHCAPPRPRRQTIDIYVADDGRSIIGMPHPSRYTLFHRADGESDLAEQNFLIALGTNSTHALPIGKPSPS